MSTSTIQEIEDAYAEHDRHIAIGRIRIGCFLAMAMLPAGAFVDYFAFGGMRGVLDYAPYRIAGALAMIPLMLMVNTAWGQRNHRTLGVLLAMVPAAGMAAIILDAKAKGSSYYAGLNLILLAIGLVLQWTFMQSLIAVSLVILMYVGVCVLGANPGTKDIVNNLWFLSLTGILVVTGNYLQSRLRFAEFALRFRLDASQKELERSNKRLRELDELKGRFFANISHELRTPLTLLLAPLEALRVQAGISADGRLRENLDTMHANGLRLLKLINDLLDLVRLETGKLRLKPEMIEVTRFLRGLVNAVKRVAEDKGLKVVCDVDPSIDEIAADPDKLEKVFLNLLFNSVKFTPAGGTITVSAEPDGDDVIFRVTDTGVGINPEHLPYIFDRFWQADDASNRKFQGTGIGLALVKELVEAHRGTVVAESEPGVGTSMIIRLPKVAAGTVLPTADSTTIGIRDIGRSVTTPEMAQVADKNWLTGLYRRAEMFPGFAPLRDSLRPMASPGTGSRPRLLIADDEPDMLRFLQSQLGEDYEVIEASDGEQAITMASQYLPGVILCDMMLPEKDGLQVCRTLRSAPPTRDIPIMILTARADDETKLQCLAAGANDFVTKPFSTAELRVRLKNLVDNNQLQKALAWQNKKLAATVEQLKETELQLVQSEKMASLGRMSAGIIHEINNPINFAKTGLFTLEKKAGLIPEAQRDDYREIIHDIEEGITRVAAIVADLRTFTHPQGGAEEDVDINHCLGAALRFLAAEMKGKVEVEHQVPEDFVVRANRNKLLQVFVNLLQNSLDALAAKADTDSQRKIRVTAVEQDGTQRVVFWDNGPGIEEEIIGKVFDPFFTTKEPGQGTGLGLSICYRILAEFGGRITVRSRLGEFTEFSLEFQPVAHGSHAE